MSATSDEPGPGHSQVDDPDDGPVLRGRRIVLRPLRPDDTQALAEAAADGELWCNPHTQVPTVAQMPCFVEEALLRRSAGHEMPFVIEAAGSGTVIGHKRYVDASPERRTVEISHAWVAGSHQRQGVNTEADYLLLRFAFETLECVRVQFRCDELNTASRQGLLALGAREEGLLRHERVMPDGRKRNAVIFGVTDDEWPNLRTRLQQRLGLTRT